MRRASFIAFTVGGMLILGPASDVWAQSGAGGTPRAGWYVGGDIGANWASDIDQEGWNRDPLCYPTDACFDADPVPEISGYRWRYDIDAAAGAVFEISTGLILDRTRLELSLAQRKNSLDQMFRSITDYDGMAMEERRGSWRTSCCGSGRGPRSAAALCRCGGRGDERDDLRDYRAAVWPPAGVSGVGALALGALRAAGAGTSPTAGCRPRAPRSGPGPLGCAAPGGHSR